VVRQFPSVATLFAVFVLFSSSTFAGITVFKDGDQYVKIGGRIQLQYHQEDPEGGEVTDQFFFRRLRPYIEGSGHPHWHGKLQWELGGANGDNEVEVKDAYAVYTGLPGITISIGNSDFPFSRELLTSSKKTQLVERSFVGDHNFGTPDKNLNLGIHGRALENKIYFAAALANAAIDPDHRKLDFDTPVNKNTDFNEGVMVGGRMEFQPLRPVGFSQGDFDKRLAVAFGVGVFGWVNDDDNNTNTNASTGTDLGNNTPDVDRATGVEASASLRGYGISFDLQGNWFNSETKDGNYTGGLYQLGEATFHNASLEAGYMIIDQALEVVAGSQFQDSDTYQRNWVRNSLGLNYFVRNHDIKLQTTFRRGKNLYGIRNDNLNEIFVQGQYVF